jgi:carbonic anhydrase
MVLMKKLKVFSIFMLITSGILLVSSNSAVASDNSQPNYYPWSYEGEKGPEHWGELDPSFELCSKGTEQSPINFESADVKKAGEDFFIKYEPTEFEFVDRRYTLETQPQSGKNRLKLNGEKYKLLQLHFHYPSEHLLNGKQFAMELHLVHKSADGDIAVVGLWVEEGEKNQVLAPLFNNLNGGESELIDLTEVLSVSRRAFTYEGSLTTPPCTEGVTWIMLAEPIEASERQIEALQNQYEKGNRLVLPLGERKIKQVKINVE